MTDAFILDMPVKLGPEFVTIVGADFLDPKRELLNDMINEVDRVSVRVFGVNFECPDPRRVVDRGIMRCMMTLTTYHQRIAKTTLKG